MSKKYKIGLDITMELENKTNFEIKIPIIAFGV